MSEHGSSSTPQVQFDVAEYSSPQLGVPSCAACKRPIAGPYYTVNRAAVCDHCHTQHMGSSQGASKFKRALAATGWGLLAGLAGAAIWFAVRKLTGYEIGLIAVLVGVMVGTAVRKGAKGRGGWFYQTLAIALTYSCICAQYVPDLVESLMDGKFGDQSAVVQPANQGKLSGSDAAPADSATAVEPANPAAVSAGHAPKHRTGIRLAIAIVVFGILALIFSLALPFLGGFQNILGLAIIGFALYEAWKINKRPAIEVAGPFPPPVARAPVSSMP
jgi:hypothetical protein